MKKLVKVLLVLVVLAVLVVVGGVVGVGMYANQLAKKGIEKGGTYALGVPTTVSSVSLGLLSGKFGMSGLNVANPAAGGYTSNHFLNLGSGSVAVNYSSLQQPTIDLPALTLSKVDVSLEKKGGKANYQTILENLKKLQDQTGGGTKPTSGDEKKFVIQKLLIEDITVHVDMLDAGGLSQLAKLTIPVEKIELTNLGKSASGVQADGVQVNGVTMEQLASIVVQAVLKAAMDNSGGLLPADLLNDLQSNLGQLTALKDLDLKAVGDVKNIVDKLGKDLGKGVGDAADKAIKDVGKDAADKIGKGIGDLIGGGDKDKKK